jgi:hypothetical protein
VQTLLPNSNLRNSSLKANLPLLKDIQIFCTQVLPSKFIFLKVMPRDNFGELLGFFPKGLVLLKIQTNFKYWLLPKFLIQTPFGF